MFKRSFDTNGVLYYIGTNRCVGAVMCGLAPLRTSNNRRDPPEPPRTSGRFMVVLGGLWWVGSMRFLAVLSGLVVLDGSGYVLLVLWFSVLGGFV